MKILGALICAIASYSFVFQLTLKVDLDPGHIKKRAIWKQETCCFLVVLLGIYSILAHILFINQQSSTAVCARTEAYSATGMLHFNLWQVPLH